MKGKKQSRSKERQKGIKIDRKKKERTIKRKKERKK